MTKSELIRKVADKNGWTVKEATLAVASIIESIVAGVKREGKVEITGFATFEKKTAAARTGRNPKTGEAVSIPEKEVIKCKLSKKFLD